MFVVCSAVLRLPCDNLWSRDRRWCVWIHKQRTGTTHQVINYSHWNIPDYVLKCIVCVYPWSTSDCWGSPEVLQQLHRRRHQCQRHRNRFNLPQNCESNLSAEVSLIWLVTVDAIILFVLLFTFTAELLRRLHIRRVYDPLCRRSRGNQGEPSQLLWHFITTWWQQTTVWR